MAARVSKSSVRYRRRWVLFIFARKACGTCSMYRNGRCTLVEGKIAPQDVCDRWEARR